jgi:hypothetical protein
VYEEEGIVIQGNFPPMRHSGHQATTDGNGKGNVGGCMIVTKRVLEILDRTVAESEAHLDSKETIKKMLQEVRTCVEGTWRELGFKSDVHVSMDPLSGDFCSGRLYPVHGKWYFIPKLGKFLCRLGCSVSSERTPQQVLGIMEQFRPLMKVPFIGITIERIRMLLLSAGVEPEDMSAELKYSNYNNSKDVPAPQSDSWEWCHKMYGIGAYQEQTYANRLRTVFTLPYQLQVPEIEPLFTTDLLGRHAAISWLLTSLTKYLFNMAKGKGRAPATVKKIEKAVEKQLVRTPKKQDVRHKDTVNTETNQFAKNMMPSMSLLEAETIQGVHTYVNPWTSSPGSIPHGRPSNVGVTGYTVRASTTLTTNAAGFLAFNITAPGFIPDGAAILPQPDASSRTFALTQGMPVWWTSSANPATTVPAAGLAASANNVGWAFPGGIIPGILAQNYIRCSGAGFWIYPESPDSTTQGDVTLYRFKDLNRAGAVNANGANKGTLTALDESVVSIAQFPLANWRKNEAAHMAVLPTSMSAQLYTPVPTTGYLLSPLAHCGFVVTGAPNQAIVVEWIYQISCTNTVSYRADDNVTARPPLTAPLGMAPRAELMEHYAPPKVAVMESEKGGEAAKVVLHDKMEKENMTKAESKSWLQSAVDWGFENLGPVVKTVAEVLPFIAMAL